MAYSRRASSLACAAIRRSASSRDAALLESGEPDVGRRLHHDHRGELPLGPGAAVGQEWDVTDDDGIRRRLTDPHRELVDDRGPGDPVQGLTGFLVGERNPREARPIEATVREQDGVAETPDQGGKGGLAWLHDRPGGDVSVDDRGALFP